MSKMSNIDLILQNVKNWFEENIENIILAIIITLVAFLVHAQTEIDINNIEERLTKQEHYMRQAQDNIDNLYRRIDNDK